MFNSLKEFVKTRSIAQNSTKFKLVFIFVAVAIFTSNQEFAQAASYNRLNFKKELLTPIQIEEAIVLGDLDRREFMIGSIEHIVTPSYEIKPTSSKEAVENFLNNRQFKNNLQTEVLPKAESTGNETKFSIENILDGLVDLENILNQIIKVGKIIVDIVVSNQPTIEANIETMSVIPAAAADNWELMSGWKHPVYYHHTIIVKNGFGIVNMKLNFSARMQPGGQFNSDLDGKPHGSYIQNLQIVPTEVYVGWGWHAKAWVEHGEPTNMGTKQEPIAGMVSTINLEIQTLLFKSIDKRMIFSSGDGLISCGNCN